MKKIINYVGVIVLLIGIISLEACSKKTDIDRFIGGKDFIYAGKPDSAKVLSGNKRVKFSWVIQSDPNIKSAVIYWNGKSDSVSFPIERSQGIDTIEYVLDLPEGKYSFEIYTINNEGFTSVPVSVSGESFGDKYKNTLLGRGIVSAVVAEDDNQATIIWGASEETSIGVWIEYMDTFDEKQTLFVSNEEDTTLIADYNPSENFSYETFFKPNENAIDSFSAGKEVVEPVVKRREVEVDKANFAAITLPGDAVSDASGAIEHLWDGLYSTDIDNPFSPAGWKSVTANVPLGDTAIISFDLGVKVQLTRYLLRHYYPYTVFDMAEYEIWGKEELSDNEDGSMNGWDKLIRHLSPVGNADDYAQGEHVDFAEDIPVVRYLRIKVIKNRKNDPIETTKTLSLAEMDFWGYLIQ